MACPAHPKYQIFRVEYQPTTMDDCGYFMYVVALNAHDCARSIPSVESVQSIESLGPCELSGGILEEFEHDR